MAHNTTIAVAVAKAMQNQPWFARRKDTIITVLTGVVWVAAFVGSQFTNLPELAAVLIASAATFAGALGNALTPGAITPSMVGRLSDYVEESLPVPADMDLPVVDFDTSAS